MSRSSLNGSVDFVVVGAKRKLSTSIELLYKMTPKSPQGMGESRVQKKRAARKTIFAQITYVRIPYAKEAERKIGEIGRWQ